MSNYTILLSKNNKLLTYNLSLTFEFYPNEKALCMSINEIIPKESLVNDVNFQSIFCGIRCANIIRKDRSIISIVPYEYMREIPHFGSTIISPVIDCCSGSYHTLILLENGSLYSFGSNYFGQLGFKKSGTDFNEPQLLMIDKNIKSIHCGNDFSLILKNNGYLYGFGINDRGELGISNNTIPEIVSISYTPKLIMKNSKIKFVTCGHHHTMVLTDDGYLYGFGSNYYGQLGINDDERTIEPHIIMIDPNIQIIACGGYAFYDS